ncbi:MAG: hypothetical protein AAFY38_10410 [Pseudomonadota bacterium]
MRRREVTETALADILHNRDFLSQRAPHVATLYYQKVLQTFMEFPDDVWLPHRASDDLPEFVRVMYPPSPFRQYPIWVAFTEDALYLVAAFAPGLTEEQQIDRSQSGLDEIHD